VSVSATLVTTRTCRLRRKPVVTIFDAAGRVLAKADVDMLGKAGHFGSSDALRVNATNEIYGSWYAFCTASTKPYHVAIEVTDTRLSSVFETPLLPLCFTPKGAPATPEATVATGRLDLWLEVTPPG